MPISAAWSVLSASLLILLLLAGATGAPVAADAGGNTTSSSNATLAATGAGDSPETYICYLCAGRNPLLMRWCPIYWPDCHAYDCYYPPALAAAVPAAATAPAPTVMYGEEKDDPCYVMKLFQNGTYVVVTHIDCTVVSSCRLSCGGGDVIVAATDEKAFSALAAPQAGTLLPRVADFQRCASQVTARAPVVPSGP